MKRKAFIGPLGDDIPSIFPIMAGVLLFLGTVAYATQLVDEKNKDLDTRRGALAIAYLATDKGYSDEASFFQKCETSIKPTALSYAVKFAVVVKKFCNYYNAGTPVFDNVTHAGTDDVMASSDVKGATCANTCIVSGCGFDPSRDAKNSVQLVYPTSVKCNGVSNGMGTITVIAWK